jgi:hypothetical protein
MDFITPVAYADVFKVMEGHNVPYVVVGGVAVVLHGHIRPILDLDIVVGPAPEQKDLAIRVVMLAGFFPSIPLPPSLLTVLRMFDQSQRELDLFFSYQIPFAELWTNCVEIPVGDSIARVACVEDLLRDKRITGTTRDFEDIDGLLTLKNIDHDHGFPPHRTLPDEAV